MADTIMRVARPSARPFHRETAPAACGPNVAANVMSGFGGPEMVTVGFEGLEASSAVEFAEVVALGRMENWPEME